MNHCFAALCAAVLLTSGVATAQDFPTKPVKVIVPYQAGGGLDMMCRTIVDKVSESLRQPFVVENRVGGAGTIGAAAVAHAAPDGYTILCSNNSEITLAQFVIAKLPYDPERDLAPVTMAVRQTVVLAANPAVPATDVRQLLDLTRKQPVTYSTSGIGSNLHLAMEMFSASANAPFVHVPYKGAASLVTDTVAGHVQLAVINLAPLVQHIRDQRLRPMLVFQSERNPAIPDVPTAKEAIGVEVIAPSWFGFSAPAKTPAPIVEKLDQEIRKALADPAVKSKLSQVYMDIVALPSARFLDEIRKERALNAKLVRQFDIKPE